MRYMVLVSVIGCILLAGFRFDSDFDFNSYVQIFDAIPPLSQGLDAFAQSTTNLYLEPTFSLMVATVKIFLPDLWIFTLISTASLLLYYRTFNRVATFPAFAFLIYIGDGFYLREFTQVRFGLAVSIGFSSMVALYEGRAWIQRVLVVLACLFHFTAIMLIFTQIWTKYIRSRQAVIFTSTFLLLIALSGLFDNIVQSIAGFNLAPQRILDHLGTENAEKISTINLITSYIILVWMTHIIHTDDKDFFWVSIYALSFAFLCIFSGFDLMRRVSFYFSVAMYVVASQAMLRRRFDFAIMITVFALMLFHARLNILNEYQNWLFI